MCFDPSNNRLASSDVDGCISIWDLKKGKRVSAHHEHVKMAYCVSYSPVQPCILASGSEDHTGKFDVMTECVVVVF